jgi:transposase
MAGEVLESGMATKLVVVDRMTPMLLPCDLRDWVAADDLVHFVIEAVEGMDLSGVTVNERGTGSAQYPPGMLLALLIYSYANGVFSSRRIERSTYQQVSVRYLCGETHPDHDTIAAFRTRHGELLRQAFTEVLRLARALKLVHLGTVHIDGTKILASLDGGTLDQQLDLLDRELAEKLLVQAALADTPEADEAYRLPQELANAAQRKAKLQAARELLAQRTGGGKSAPTVNLTDPDSRIMPSPKGGFVQAYNAQLAVESRGLIVGQTVCQATSDRAELVAVVATIPAEPGAMAQVVADMGYDNQSQIAAVEEQWDTMVICAPQPGRTAAPAARCTAQRAQLAAARQRRGRWARQRFGRELLHQRQTTIEPVIGHLKHVLGFRRFHVRGLEKVRGEWSLLATAYNCRRLWSRLQLRARK